MRGLRYDNGSSKKNISVFLTCQFSGVKFLKKSFTSQSPKGGRGRGCHIGLAIYGFAIYGLAIYGFAIYGFAIHGFAIYGLAIYGFAIYGFAIYVFAIYGLDRNRLRKKK